MLVPKYVSRISFLFILSSLLVLLACQPTDRVFPSDVDVPALTMEETPTAKLPAEKSETTPESIVVIDKEQPSDDAEFNPLPQDPLEQRILTSDGVELAGTFYPAAFVDAPLVILLHWALGDQTVWYAIAPWLQNRGFQSAPSESGQPWMDPSWFPKLPDEVSFNVLTFTFRGCEGGCQRFDREGWLVDLEAVMTYVIGLEKVDIGRVATIGASIGADGAVYGCHYYNHSFGGCQGALSLSPGGYLTIPYPEEVANLQNDSPPTPAWCVYSTGDADSARACEHAAVDHYRIISYAGRAHGLAMIEPDRQPNPLKLMLEFLNDIGLCEACQ